MLCVSSNDFLASQAKYASASSDLALSVLGSLFGVGQLRLESGKRNEIPGIHVREENLVEEEVQEEEVMVAEGGTSRSAKSKDVKDEIEMARLAGQRHVKKILQHILSQFKFVLSQMNLADMVVEEHVPDIK